MKAFALLLLLAVVSLSTIGEDVKPIWLSTLEEPEPVNVGDSPSPYLCRSVPSLNFSGRVYGEGFVSIWSKYGQREGWTA